MRHSCRNIKLCTCSAEWLTLDKTRVAVVPGTAFGKAGENHIRISITGSEESLLEAIERLNTQLQYV
ncbi:hypothetical protein [Candidatus Tisiphia endosymbiont of Parasteatoda lunata]|uniref:hypothetical protein n=1 Tax=Candidatus Tisiphia endosymbiont of Parasteatoda lunata TaxID=3066275 RepID=UPI00313EAF63